jgi:hypothetical protein
MTDKRREQLRRIMLQAWHAYRAEPSRGFADALRGAWAFNKRLDAYYASGRSHFAGATGHVHLKPVWRSPIARTHGRTLKGFHTAALAGRLGR